MRIIGGRYRGLVLSEFGGKQIRPTADRVKESLFNILMYRIAGARVLDLFCGSGNLGIECISRGAAYVHFNDISADSVQVLKRNLAKLKGEENFCVTRCDYADCLRGIKDKFDIVFIDPPYADECGRKAVEAVGRLGLLNDGGALIYERDRSFLGKAEGLCLTDERKYGKTYLTFFTADGAER